MDFALYVKSLLLHALGSHVTAIAPSRERSGKSSQNKRKNIVYIGTVDETQASTNIFGIDMILKLDKFDAECIRGH
ncbi:hypothetical protein DM02DRAFT_658759 [Periconia macrospinosa]|uniref:Uncharacterized protein n=1 Tax=Periconia macrospinosa TaxID=97972 RepID=A0A2V1DFZ5_9PLEO|nr:hypothetical protein DM02DRAFT_658759 [Periconia macrospinosa]